MKARNTITKLVALTVAAAAVAVIGSICWTARAQHVEVFSGESLAGFIPGQTLRFSVAYPGTTEEGGGPVRVRAAIYDSDGNLVRRADAVELSAGQFRTFDFKRDDLPLVGEPGSGRLQVRGVVQFVLVDGSVRPVKSFPVTIEVFDSRTGATTGGAYYTGSVTVSDDGLD